MSAGRLQRTRESSSARSPSNAENPVPCNTSWFKTDLNSPGYATLSLKMGYSKERAHVPWAGPDKALPPPSGGPPDHQTLHLGALSSRHGARCGGTSRFGGLVDHWLRHRTARCGGRPAAEGDACSESRDSCVGAA
mgnify:CR=1 FL=1